MNSQTGCTNSNALNFDPNALESDGSCLHCDTLAAEFQPVIDTTFNPSSSLGIIHEIAQTFTITQTINNPIIGLNIEQCDQMAESHAQFRIAGVNLFGEPNWNASLAQAQLDLGENPNTSPCQAENADYVYNQLHGLTLQGGQQYAIILSLNVVAGGSLNWYGENEPTNDYTGGEVWEYFSIFDDTTVTEFSTTDLGFKICGDLPEFGCTNNEAINYSAQAMTDDGSCVYGSFFCGPCTTWDALSEMCIPLEECYPCFGDANGDHQITSTDLTAFLSAFGSICE